MFQTSTNTQAMQSKLKVHLKLSISRLRIVQQKDTAIAKQQRRELAQLLEAGKYESARIRVENVIRSDLTTELLEVLELYCELLLARIGLLEPHQCDPGLEEAVKSIIYAAPRTEIRELQQTRQLLVEKYGKEFALVAMDNKDGKVPERVLKKLRVEPPPTELVESYLKEIARTYDVKYGEDEAEDEDELVDDELEQDQSNDNENDGNDDDEPPSGRMPVPAASDTNPSTKALSKMTPPRDLGPRSPVQIAPPSPSTDNANPKLKLPGAPELKPNAKMKKANDASGSNKPPPAAASKPNGAAATASSSSSSSTSKVDGTIPDVKDLEKRFAMLKR